MVILILSLQCCNKDEQGKVFANRDAVYVLCYAILMLNTDQYSAQVRKRMSLEVHVHVIATCTYKVQCILAYEYSPPLSTIGRSRRDIIRFIFMNYLKYELWYGFCAMPVTCRPFASLAYTGVHPQPAKNK